MKPHKHAEIIKAWADGAEIQVRTRGFWITSVAPKWFEEKEYRIKPERKPELEKVTMYIYNNTKDGRTWMDEYPNEMLYPEWKYMGSIEVLK